MIIQIQRPDLRGLRLFTYVADDSSTIQIQRPDLRGLRLLSQALTTSPVSLIQIQRPDLRGLRPIVAKPNTDNISKAVFKYKDPI